MGEPPSKKRKVRKGTRSCWQCEFVRPGSRRCGSQSPARTGPGEPPHSDESMDRVTNTTLTPSPSHPGRKRKIRCEFASSDAQSCAGCQIRGVPCVSQEFTDDAPAGLPERGLAQRLGRLEEMMVKLADKLGPGSTNDDKSGSTPTSSSVDESLYASESFATPDKLVVQPTTTNNVATTSSPSTFSPSVPPAASSEASHRHEKLCKELFSAFPSPRSVKTLVESSRGPIFILVLFYSNRDILEGRSPSTASLSTLPDASQHPAILAKRLLELTICLQQLPPSYDASQLGLPGSIHDTMNEWAAAAGQVTSNDELVGSAEGLQCLILQGFYLTNSGNLRKAWLAMRRALSLAQLIGIERNGGKPLASCDAAAADRATIPASHQFWYRINMCDRYLSLLLGLPAGTKDNGFMSENFIARDTPVEKLEKRYVTIALRVIERNHASANEAYAMTQSIDCELESAANAMGRGWWVMPPLPGDEVDVTTQMSVMSHLMLQIHHHSLLILLHLPYMLRNPTNNRFDYSKNVCLESSRAVLRRCVTFRAANNASFSCRHIDYSSLMAAMTLLLGHLSRPPGFRDDDEWLRQRAEDRALAQSATAMMEQLAVLNDDKLSGESAEIIKQLLPIVDCCCNGSAACRHHHHHHHHDAPGAEACNVQLSIPYLGTINININTSSNQQHEVTAACNVDLGRSQLPTPPANTTTTVTPSSMSPNQQQQQANASVSVDPLLDEPDPSVGAEDVYDAAAALGLNHAALGLNPDCLEWLCPGVTAEAGDWAFQGVDTTYWSLLNSGISGFSQ